MKNIYALAAVLLLAAVSMSAQTRLQLNNTAPGGGYGASFIILPPLTPTTGTVELRFPTTSGTALIEDGSGMTNLTSLNATGPATFGSTVNIDGGLTIQHNPANDSTTYTLGLRFQNDPYGGGSDLAGLRMYNRNNTEDMIMEFYTNNDGNDKINFSVNNGTYGVTINNYPIITTDNASTLLSGSLAGSYWSLGGNTLGSVQRLGSNDNYAIAFETNNTERMRLDTDGDLGIGTTNPESPLHVARATNAGTTYIQLMNSAAAGTLGNAVQISFSNDVGATRLVPNTFIRSENTGGGSNAATLSFGTYDGSAVTTKMSIDPDGVVGVSNKLVVGATATTVPMELRASGALGVGENYRNTDAAVFNVRNTGSTTTSNAAVAISTNNSTGGDPILSWDIENVGGWSMGIDNADDDKLKIIDTWDFDIASGNTLMTLDMTSNSVSMMEIRLLEPSASGSNFTAFKAQAQSGDITYTLPAADGSSGQFLSTNGSGTLAWSNAGLQYFTETRNTTAPNATVPVHQLIASGSETNIDLAIRPKGSGAITADVADGTATGGDKRGANAVDLQRLRSLSGQVAHGEGSVLVGGKDNAAVGAFSSVVGGENNQALNGASFPAQWGGVFAGKDNVVQEDYAGIIAGLGNNVNGSQSVIAGGNANYITGTQSFIGGGAANNLSGSLASIIGGRSDTLDGNYSVVLAGRGSRLQGSGSLLFNGNTTSNNINITESSTAVFANANMWLANTNNTASELRFYEAQATGGTGAFPVSGTNYTAFKAGTQAADITYTLPTADGSSGQFLSTNGSGTLAWSNAGLQYFTESRNTTAPNATVPVHQLIASGTETDIDMALRPKGTGALTADVADGATTGGNKRGARAVDLQRERGAATHVASGTGSGVLSGGWNTSSGTRAVIAGGLSNTASGQNSFIGGGGSNAASGIYASVMGGYENVAAGYASSIAGGTSMTVSGTYSFGFNASNISGGANYWPIAVSSNSAATFANADLWLANTRNQASELRFYEAQSATGAFPAAGTNYTAFKAGTQAADITYTLPTADGSSGQVLSTDGSGTLSWASALTASSQSTYTATAITGLSYSSNNINLAAFTGTYEKVTVPAPAAASTVTLPAGTDGQVMYVRFAFTAGTGTVTINNDGGTATAMVYDGAGSDVIVAHMLYTTTEKWVVLSAQYFNN